MMVFILSVAVLGGCAMFGRLLLSICGVNNLSIMGGSLVLGYGIFGLALLFSLKYLDNPMIGALIFAGLLGAMTTRRFNSSRIIYGRTEASQLAHIDIRTQPSSHSFVSKIIDGLIAVVLVSWVVAIALTFIPLGWLTVEPKYQFPEIYDLPKHFFAMLSLYEAKDWPPPNPFFSNEIFAYNFLFYFPPAFTAKLVGNPLTIFQTFPLAVMAIAIALPMTVLDIVRSITQSKLAHLTSVLLATWVGGLTPFWVTGKPSIGFFLYTEKLLTSQIWVDELFQSLIFVPQHVFAVLCGLIAIFLLANIRFASDDYKRILLAGIATVVGALSSLILLPHLAASFAIALTVLFFLQWRTLGYGTLQVALRWPIIMALLLPLILILPFVTEILKWSGGTGALTTMPEISTQWFFVFSAIGMVSPFAIVGLTRVFRSKEVDGIDSHGNSMIICLAVMVMVGLIGLLFGGYPDAGIKSGLWVRIVLVPLAGVGMLILVSKITHKRIKVVVILVVVTLFFGTAIVNYPTTRYFVQSAWRPIDPGIKNFVSYIRSLPLHSRIALFSTEQDLVALSGRQIDFDFSPLRTDSYLPPEGRLRAKHFWDGFAQNDYEIWTELDQRYDYLIAPIGSIPDARLATRFTASSSIGGYSVYKTRMEQ